MIVEFIMFIIFKGPLLYTIKYSTSMKMYQVLLIGTILYVFIQLQSKYGSRFFLPNKCRIKRYEYRRRIDEDFDLAKLDESLWPEWDIWMQKLHQPSLYAGDRSLCKIEGKEWYKIYMKTTQLMNLHYFWLELLISDFKNQFIHLYEIDDYDD